MKMGTAIRVQILAETAYISHRVHTLGKGMNAFNFPPSSRYIVGQTGIFNLGIATGRGEIQEILLNVHLASHPA